MPVPDAGASPPQSQAERDLEVAIFRARMELQYGRTAADRRAAFSTLQRLHRQRTQAQVQRMEQEQGLAGAVR